jgi:hypothetical protein
MLEIHLYGHFRSLVPDSCASEDTILKLDFQEGEIFSNLIQRLGLSRDELGDCFINGKIAKPNMRLHDGDRIGLFPFNMVLLCGGQHLKGHGKTREDMDVDYY